MELESRGKEKNEEAEEEGGLLGEKRMKLRVLCLIVSWEGKKLGDKERKFKTNGQAKKENGDIRKVSKIFLKID